MISSSLWMMRLGTEMRNIKNMRKERKIKSRLVLFYLKLDFKGTVTEFKEFERRFKFKPRFKHGWLHLKLYQMFQDLSRRLI